MTVKKVLLLMRQAPYGSVYTAEGLRSVMGLGVFEMDVAMVFAGDGGAHGTALSVERPCCRAA